MLLTLKIFVSIFLSTAIAVCIPLSLMAFTTTSVALKLWGVIYMVSAVAALVGVVQCWRQREIPKITLGASVYILLLYVFVNFWAPKIASPFGFAKSLNKSQQSQPTAAGTVKRYAFASPCALRYNLT